MVSYNYCDKHVTDASFTNLTDIDECSENETICDQLCINTDGSFLCSCLEGYEFMEETNQCEGG